MPLPLPIALLAIAACAGQPASDPPQPRAACTGDAVIRNVDDAVALSLCTTVRGDVTIRGGAITALTPLASVERVTGSLYIGPTLELISISGLDALAAVDGALHIDTNMIADGVFLPQLTRVGGDVRIASNLAISGINAPALDIIGGDLMIARNPSLARIDVNALSRVSGGLDVVDNTVLDDVDMSRLGHVAGAVTIRGNPALADSAIAAIKRQMRANPPADEPAPAAPDAGPVMLPL